MAKLFLLLGVAPQVTFSLASCQLSVAVAWEPFPAGTEAVWKAWEVWHMEPGENQQCEEHSEGGWAFSLQLTALAHFFLDFSFGFLWYNLYSRMRTPSRRKKSGKWSWWRRAGQQRWLGTTCWPLPPAQVPASRSQGNNWEKEGVWQCKHGIYFKTRIGQKHGAPCNTFAMSHFMPHQSSKISSIVTSSELHLGFWCLEHKRKKA